MGIFDQLSKIWNELSGGQKLTLTVALVAVLGGMGALMYYSSKPQMRLLYGGIDAKEMSAVVAALDEEKVPYQLESGGRSVFVPQEKVYHVRMKLAGQGIPNGGGVGYEIFDKGNFGISDFVQRTNYIRALQGELARSIGQLSGVRSARVMIVLPENKLLVTNDNARPTASVFIDIGGGKFSEENVNAVRYLVANSVEGLKTNDVAVIDSAGKVLSSDSTEDASFGAATGHLKFRKSIEDYFTQKINTMLIPVVGQDNVVVRVSVDLNFDAQKLVEEKYDPEGQVVRSQTTQEESSSSTENAAGGSTGVAANMPGGTAAATNTQNSNNNSHKNRTVSYEINRSVSETVKTPGSIRSVSAAVFLAKRTENSSTASAYLTRSGAELEMIRKMVINALGLDPKDTPEQRVTVEEVAFNKPTTAPEKKSMFQAAGSTATDWLDIGRKILAVGAAVGIFMIFLKLLKSQKTEAINFEVIEEKTNTTQAPGALSAEVLNELIQQKPENVSAALKSWVSAGQNKR